MNLPVHRTGYTAGVLIIACDIVTLQWAGTFYKNITGAIEDVDHLLPAAIGGKTASCADHVYQLVCPVHEESRIVGRSDGLTIHDAVDGRGVGKEAWILRYQAVTRTGDMGGNPSAPG